MRIFQIDTLLAKVRESPPCLAYKTGRETFTSSGSSVTWVTVNATPNRTIFGCFYIVAMFV
ncbi:MAG: hypothetical protein Fur006_52100 [Coleofasciculaceae cyanobacterium]